MDGIVSFRLMSFLHKRPENRWSHERLGRSPGREGPLSRRLSRSGPETELYGGTGWSTRESGPLEDTLVSGLVEYLRNVHYT